MMLTRCPACQTVFRLQPEQLHARRGEVRCGHCFHPFNALDNEVVAPVGRAAEAESPAMPATTKSETPAAKAPPYDRMASEAASTPAANDIGAEKAAAKTGTALDFEIPEGPDPAAGADVATHDRSGDIDDDFGDEPALSDVHETSPAPRPGAAGTPQPESAASTPGVLRSGRRTPAAASAAAEAANGNDEKNDDSVASAHLTNAAEADDAEAESEAQSEAEGADAAARPDSEREPLISAWAQKQTAAVAARHGPRAEKPDAPADPKPAAAHIPRTVNSERLDAVYGPPPKPANPMLRTLAGLAVGLLAGTLAAQAIYLFRVEIGRELPGLRPLLVAACAELGCDVPLPRQAEHIGIDASELQSEPGRSGRYTLHVTLKNRAAYPIEWPHLELTLTDAGDTPLARRVITPQEWVPPERRRGGFNARDTLSSRLPFDNSGPSPSGYRVYVFYP